MSKSKTTEKQQATCGIIRDKPVDPIIDSESFKYKTSIIGKTAADLTQKDVEITVPLKYLSNFWRMLDMPLINCEVNLILTWSGDCVITDTITKNADPYVNPLVPEIRATTDAKLAITGPKLYAPVVTPSTQENNIIIAATKNKIQTNY